MSMEMAYRVGYGLYLNITNRCSSSCTFCVRNSYDSVGMSDSLWLDHDPTAEEVIEAIKSKRLHTYHEVIFCGFGEPTCAMDVLVEVATWLKENTELPVRLNTNGQGNLINGYDIVPELAGCLDAVSVSLNAPNAKRYQENTQSQFGEEAYEAMLDFTRECIDAGLDVAMTTVDTTLTSEEEIECQKICDELGVPYRIRGCA